MKKSNTFDASEVIHIHEQAVSDMSDLRVLLSAVRRELDETKRLVGRESPNFYMPIFNNLERILKLAIAENGSNLEYHFQEAANLREEYEIKQVVDGDSND
ncbi:hypothetical protein [Acinetobacter bereziniae]|uniref:hypothetical protein n=1 Tax=Acinetobacter bereziniae TaxID=106648 RepID=UPI0011179215|nr:hypothetical protein [Acinetobacter bereziniae]QQC79471.1 hypothetical protein I9192_16050 [Acinetobacter bereziniae]TNL51223.1 hypothetical protein EYB59_08865 [Acinetobacter bereziniae]TNL58467.1 hypothetical protein EYY58_11690 [Acinetobacter bereziniae]UUN92548.1 hypothetical protein I9189_015915 [Acinetobacter bereziniae]